MKDILISHLVTERLFRYFEVSTFLDPKYQTTDTSSIFWVEKVEIRKKSEIGSVNTERKRICEIKISFI